MSRSFSSSPWVLACVLSSTAACTSSSGEEEGVGEEESSASESGGTEEDSATQTETGEEEGHDFSAFDAEMDAFLADTGLEGARAAIIHGELGILHVQTYGTHELERITLLASASKVLSAGVLMHLHDEGVLDVDAPVGQYIPEAWGEPRNPDITLAQMVTNSSGLVGLVDDPTYLPYLCQYTNPFVLQDCAENIYTADDAAEVIEPDTVFRYGGGQWQLAGGIAEIVSGKTWDELIAETYREPCGIDRFGYTNHYQQFFLEQGLDEGLNYPSFVNGALEDIPPSENPNIEGGGYSDIETYAQIMLMHLRGGECDNGRSLSEESVARMQVDRIAEYGGSTGRPDLDGYGMGWWIERDTPGFYADPGAYGTFPWLDLERGIGVVIMLEDGSDTGALAAGRTRPIVEAIFDAGPG